MFFDGENARFQRRSPRSCFEFSDGNRASSVVSLSSGINSAMGVRAPNAAPINHGTGPCALRAPPPGTCRATTQLRRRRVAFSRVCVHTSLSLIRGAVRFEVWDGRPSKRFFSPRGGGRFEVWEGQTKTPRSFARLDPVFARDKSGRSVLFFHQGGVDKISYLVSLLQEE